MYPAIRTMRVMCFSGKKKLNKIEIEISNE
jgi:hypothetical protein